MHPDLQQVVCHSSQRQHRRRGVHALSQCVQVLRDEGGVQLSGGEGRVRGQAPQEGYVGGQAADLAPTPGAGCQNCEASVSAGATQGHSWAFLHLVPAGPPKQVQRLTSGHVR